MKKMILMTAMLFLFSGCTGLITGHEYKMENAKVIYQVTKLGVTTFMSEEEIKDAGLDSLNDVTVRIYELSQGNEIKSATIHSAKESSLSSSSVIINKKELK